MAYINFISWATAARSSLFSWLAAIPRNVLPSYDMQNIPVEYFIYAHCHKDGARNKPTIINLWRARKNLVSCQCSRLYFDSQIVNIWVFPTFCIIIPEFLWINLLVYFVENSHTVIWFSLLNNYYYTVAYSFQNEYCQCPFPRNRSFWSSSRTSAFNHRFISFLGKGSLKLEYGCHFVSCIFYLDWGQANRNFPITGYLDPQGFSAPPGPLYLRYCVLGILNDVLSVYKICVINMVLITISSVIQKLSD